MKWVVAIAGTLVALVLALAAVGLLQPREYVASITVRIAAPDSAVWAALTAFERMPEWYGEIRSVERIPDIDGRPAYNERHASGWVMTTVVRERIEEDRLVREFLPTAT
jgi:uncharacterized protein YndB with AHSA1/START domain